MAEVHGNRINPSDYEGQVVWLCFWRVGCPPYREGMPGLHEFYAQFKDKDLVILGFNNSNDENPPIGKTVVVCC